MSVTQPVVSSLLETSPANSALLSLLARIPGIRVTVSSSKPLGTPVFEVFVDDGNLDAEMAVYGAELAVHQQFDDARIELYVA